MTVPLTTAAAMKRPIIYPQVQKIWLPANAKAQPSPSSSGSGTILQYRNGSIVATYNTMSNLPGSSVTGDGSAADNPQLAAATGAGPFTAAHTFTLCKPGDKFVVRGFFTGDFGQPYIGPTDASDFNAGNGLPRDIPQGIEIIGEVFNGHKATIFVSGFCSDNTEGQGAVYFGSSVGTVWSGIDVIGGPKCSSGKAGIYINGTKDLTIIYTRVSGWMANSVNPGGANGVFGTVNNTGDLILAQCTLDHNGGDNGPTHNIYIAASATDPNFTLRMLNTFSNSAFYGHLIKSRAQRIRVEGCYLMGGLPQLGQSQAENYCLDICNGGKAKVLNNIFVKNASGPNSNGVCLTYATEGVPQGELDASGKPYNRLLSLQVANNTFVTFAPTYDGEHDNYPFSLFYPQVLPTSAGITSGGITIPSYNFSIDSNAFIGFQTTENPALDYRGTNFLVADFSELSEDFRLSGEAKQQGSPLFLARSYAHEARLGLLRTLTTVGAFD